MAKDLLQHAGPPGAALHQVDQQGASLRIKTPSTDPSADFSSSRVAHLGFALVAGGIGLGVVLLMPRQISGHTMSAITNFQSPAFFPALGAVFMCCLALILAGRAWNGTVIPPSDSADSAESVLWGRVSGLAMLVIAYAAGVFVVGMITASAVFIATASLTFGYRNLWMIAGLSIGIPALVYVLFEKTLNVLFPSGWVF